MCTNQGHYCFYWGDSTKDLTGRDIITEDLRQICAFKVCNATGQTYKWFDYVSRFNDTCTTKATWTAACANNALTYANISVNDVNSCFTASGGLDSATNTILSLEVEILTTSGVLNNPAVFYEAVLFINLTPYRGSLDCPSPIAIGQCGPLEAICAGFSPNVVPCACASTGGCPLCQNRDSCDRCLAPDDPTRVTNGGNDACGVCLAYSDPQFNKSCAGCDGVPKSGKTKDACGNCGGSAKTCGSKGSTAGEVVGIVIAFVFAAGLLVFFYMKRQQSRMRNDIDQLLATYQPVDPAARSSLLMSERSSVPTETNSASSGADKSGLMDSNQPASDADH